MRVKEPHIALTTHWELCLWLIVTIRLISNESKTLTESVPRWMPLQATCLVFDFKQMEKGRGRKFVLIWEGRRFVQQNKKWNEVTGGTREQERRSFHMGLHSQRWAVLKRTWETQDWLRHQTNKPLDWSDGLQWPAWNGETFQIRKRVVGADLHNTDRELEESRESWGRGSDEKMNSGKRGAGDQAGYMLGSWQHGN